MSAVTIVAQDSATVVPSTRNLWRRVGAAILADPLAVFGLLWLTLLIVVSLAGPLLAPFEVGEIVRSETGEVAVLQPPSPVHPFGTTAYGRDVFSAVILGARPVLIVGLVCAFLPTILGFLLGMWAGYARGAVNAAVSRLVEIAYAIPSDPFAIVIVALLGPSMLTIILAITLTDWKRPVRVVRDFVMGYGDTAFVKSARSSGGSSSWVIREHLAPLSLPLFFVFVPIQFSNAILAEAALSFLGFGLPKTLTWGGIMRDGFNNGALSDAWWWIIAPGVAITITALSLFLIFRPIEPLVDPRLRKRR